MDRKLIKPARGAATLPRLRAAGNRIGASAAKPAAFAGICLTAAVAALMNFIWKKAAQSDHIKLGAIKNTKQAVTIPKSTVHAAVQNVRCG